MRDLKLKIILLSWVFLGCCLPMCGQQRGKASYYSKRATGARTASGERVHHDSLTCAHRFYPFGTYLKVTNMGNQKSVIVRVTDRGPFSRGRVIDLSWGAAKAIDMLAKGIASVMVEVVDSMHIPMRPNEKMDLPMIDFEIAESGYSFIDKWKNSDTDYEEEVTETAKPQATPKRQMSKTMKTNKPNANNKKTTRQPQSPKEEKQNTWSKVFEKIKNVF